MRKLFFVLLVACGSGRPAPSTFESYGLTQSVALIDRSENAVVMLQAAPEQRLVTRTLHVGKNIARAVSSADARYLFVLSQGESPRKRPTDERASLTVIDGETAEIVIRYELPIFRDQLALDPLGRYLVIYASVTGTALVDNPNEILLLDLAAEASDSNPLSRTLRSFGGRPQRFTFSDALALPGGKRRLLVAETEKDLAILDLERLTPGKGEVTVRLDLPTAAAVLAPNGITFDDGRIAARLKGDSSVLVLDMIQAADGDLSARTNLIDVGGEPSQISFLDTDGGRRMVALVPTKKNAALVTVETAAVQPLALPGAYEKLVFVDPSSPLAPRSALLWGQGVALWSLDLATGRPFASVESVALPGKITSVRDLPGTPSQKLLVSDNSAFFVLDLNDRTVAPLITQSIPLQYYLPDGTRRLWVFGAGQPRASRVNLGTLQPKGLVFDRNIAAMYEVPYIDGDSEQRALIVLHGEGMVGATVLDPEEADEANARVYSGLLYGGAE